MHVRSKFDSHIYKDKSEVKFQFSLVAERTLVLLADPATSCSLYNCNICEIIPLPDHSNNLDKI